MCCRFDLRNPPLAWRAVLVALFLALPGALTGGLVSLLLGRFALCSIVGGLAGLLAGATMEAWPGPTGRYNGSGPAPGGTNGSPVVGLNTEHLTTPSSTCDSSPLLECMYEQ